MEKKFISFEEMGYKDAEFFDAEGNKHLDNGFIGVYGNTEGWELAYCDSITGEIIPQDIFENGELVDIDLLELDRSE